MGRKSLLTDELQAKAAQMARAGTPQKVIAESLRIDASTMRLWCKFGNREWKPREGEYCPEDREPYFAFFAALREAQAHPVILAEAIWLKAIQGGDWKAARDWLRLHRPDVYREQQDINVTFGDRQSAMDAWKKGILDMDAKPGADDDEAGAPA